MTQTSDRCGHGSVGTNAELYALQLDGIAAWTARVRARRAALAAAPTASRELGMVRRRSEEVLEQEHAALVAHLDRELRSSGDDPLPLQVPRRAVVVHRQEWFLRGLSRALEDGDVRVVAATDNGADAVGVCAAEQPDLLVLDSKLAMVSALDVVRDVRALSPLTLVAAQCEQTADAAALVEAGAQLTFPRRQAAGTLAHDLLTLLLTEDPAALAVPT